ncbi:MAG: AAA family ATPase [Candidatus Caldatribacteriaceae bacterium]
MIFLKSIVLQGFKSFAHLTTVEFSPGLNVVVGPNGSGKSNLLDAFHFILGEKGREGRGGRVNWVIFHGSVLSKPLGMAMVETNWVENENNASWSIERRIFASGESEYFWNGEKIRLGEARLKAHQRGFSLERMNMGVVSSDQLMMLFECRPRERMQWMEQMSGILEIKTKLNALLIRLERVKEREQRFRERLKEIQMQVERLRGMAQEEMEYLQMEQEVRLAKKWYYWKLKSLKEERINTLQRERGRLEEELKGFVLKIDQRRKEFSLQERELDSILSSLRVWQSEEEEWKSVQRKLEEELYYLVTRCRESVKLSLGYEEKWRIMEKGVAKLENQVREWWQRRGKWVDCFNGDRAQEKISYLRKEYLQKIALLDEERISLERKLSQQEMSLKRFREECQEKESQKDKIQKELERLTQQMDQKRVLRDSLLKRKNVVEEEIQRSGERLQKKDLLFKSIMEKVSRLQEGRLSPEVQKIMRRLHQEGWTQRSLYALSWFLQDKGWYEKGKVHLGELKAQNLGKIVFPLPFSSWSLHSPSEIQSLLQKDAVFREHLVSADGSCLVLQGGILVFPFQTVSPERGLRFLKSLKKRRAQLETEINTERRRREDLKEELQRIERRLWEIDFELERDEQQKAKLAKEYQRVVLFTEQGKKGEEEIQKTMKELYMTLSGLREEKKDWEIFLKSWIKLPDEFKASLRRRKKSNRRGKDSSGRYRHGEKSGMSFVLPLNGKETCL